MSAKLCGCGQKPGPEIRGSDGEKAHRPAGRHLRRSGELAGWVLPTATLALMPKCPACVAGYIALFTGIGVSLPVAAFLRWSLVFLCLASLIYVGVRSVRSRVCE